MQPSQRSRLLKFYSQGNAPQGGWKIQRGSCQRAPGVWDSPRAPRTTLERSSRRSAAIGARDGRGRARGARVGDFEASVGARGLGVAGAWPPLRGGRERPRGRVTSPWLRRRGESGAITKCKLGVQFGTYLQQSTALSDISSRTTASRNVAELHTARSRACCAAPGRFTTASKPSRGAAAATAVRETTDAVGGRLGAGKHWHVSLRDTAGAPVEHTHVDLSRRCTGRWSTRR